MLLVSKDLPGRLAKLEHLVQLAWLEIKDFREPTGLQVAVALQACKVLLAVLVELDLQVSQVLLDLLELVELLGLQAYLGFKEVEALLAMLVQLVLLAVLADLV